MRRTRSKSELYVIQAEAMLRFATTYGSGGQVVSDVKAQKRVKKYCQAFFEGMSGDQPYGSVDEAVNKIAPIVIWGFGWLSRQFAIMVIKWLWNRWHSDT